MAKIHKEDIVVVTAGKDKGKEGRVLEVLRNKKTGQVDRVVVEGVQFATLHHRLQQAQGGHQGTTGGIETEEAPISISNVALKDPTTGKKTRVGYREEVKEVSGVKKMKRVRIAKASGKGL
ncbi:MAG: 50S ribosomal protein L24 [Candidatus Ancillula sp.]|jgi:large subunit ribosomal protein L24|nr:50S ribosomal protein L24 [Candidatus Ancillula sp.]